MELIRGSWDNLEGRAIIYSRYEAKDLQFFDQNKVPVEDGKLFAKHISISDKGYEDCAGLVKFISDMLKEFAKQSKAPSQMGVKIMPMMVKDIEIKSEQELKDSNGDILFTGGYNNPNICEAAASLGTSVYRFRVMNSRNQDLWTDITPKENNYQAVGSEKLLVHIRGEYISRMIDMARYGDKKGFKAFKRRFMYFSRGSLFEKDAAELSDMIELGGKNQDIEMINWYMNIMVSKRKIEESEQDIRKAVSEERYEDAAKKRDEILNLKKIISR